MAIALGERRSITVAGPSLSLASLAAVLGELLTRIRDLGHADIDLQAAAKLLSDTRMEE